MASESQLLADPNEPLGRVVLVPSDGISVVHRKLMVEIMIAFTKSYQRSSKMISWCMLVIERSFAQPMSKRVDTERRLLHIYSWVSRDAKHAQGTNLHDEQHIIGEHLRKHSRPKRHPRTTRE